MAENNQLQIISFFTNRISEVLRIVGHSESEVPEMLTKMVATIEIRVLESISRRLSGDVKESFEGLIDDPVDNYDAIQSVIKANITPAVLNDIYSSIIEEYFDKYIAAVANKLSAQQKEKLLALFKENE